MFPLTSFLLQRSWHVVYKANMLGVWLFSFCCCQCFSFVVDRLSVTLKLLLAGHCLCVCRWCAHLVLSGLGDSLPGNCWCFKYLPRKCCCLKFQQSWNRTKQALPFGCACGKGKADVKISFHVFGSLSKEIREAGRVVKEIECLQGRKNSFLVGYNGS